MLRQSVVGFALIDLFRKLLQLLVQIHVRSGRRARAFLND